MMLRDELETLGMKELQNIVKRLGINIIPEANKSIKTVAIEQIIARIK